ncbi:MAG: hypothetical protein JWN82_669 [Candidatus Saccharibacteria bacterium]|nr:hypothetical protein [Candidatus Saccharibacteria bacterium]
MTTPVSETIPVDSYQPTTDAVEKLLDYPGDRPATSFMTNGTEVVLLPEAYQDFVEAADERLRELDLPTIEERIPVLAYGSNASPARLRDKMSKFATDSPEAMQTIPHCMATLPDTIAVWHGQPGQTGSIFAELYRGPEARGASLRAHVAFLTREQLAAVHTTEGKTYSVAELPVKIGNERSYTETSVLSYVALKSQVLLRDEKPVLVSNLTHNGSTLPAMKAEEAVVYILDHAARDADVPHDVHDYVAEGIGLKSLSARVDRQMRVGRVLRGMGLNRPYAFAEANPESLIGRADFTSIPGNHDKHLYAIPEMLLPAGLARQVSARALVELSERTGQHIVE